MKKIFAFIASISIAIHLYSAMVSSAFDYEYHTQTGDGYSYYTCDEHKTGVFSAENNIFSDCDLYTSNYIEEYSDGLNFTSNYEYIMVPDDIIGNWFNNRKGDPYFDGEYYIKLPLETSCNLDYFTMELEDSHIYKISAVKQKAPYIKVISDTNLSFTFDMEEIQEIFPEIQAETIAEDENGKYIYYLSNDSGTEKILTKDDAKKLLEFKNDHLISMNYCEECELKEMSLNENLVYSADNAGIVGDYLQKCGIDFTCEDFGNDKMIVPAEKLSAPEYYNLISEIQAETGIMTEISTPEPVLTQTNSTEIFNKVKFDTNSDGQFNIADIVTLQNFILGKGNITGVNSDINSDGSVDVFDMILIRQNFLPNT